MIKHEIPHCKNGYHIKVQHLRELKPVVVCTKRVGQLYFVSYNACFNSSVDSAHPQVMQLVYQPKPWHLAQL